MKTPTLSPTPVAARRAPSVPMRLLLVLGLIAAASLASAKDKMPETPVDVNTATAAQIAKAMKGVGMKIATRIVEFREKHGPFPTLEALVEVRGIGKRLLKRNMGRVVAEPVKKPRR